MNTASQCYFVGQRWTTSSVSLPFTTLNPHQNVVNESDFHICFSSPKHTRGSRQTLFYKEVFIPVKMKKSVVEKVSWSLESLSIYIHFLKGKSFLSVPLHLKFDDRLTECFWSTLVTVGLKMKNACIPYTSQDCRNQLCLTGTVAAVHDDTLSAG